jgi:hypothetical protein
MVSEELFMKIMGLSLLSLLAFTAAISAQSRNVIADGQPALTQTMVNRLTRLMEWSLNTDLNDEEHTALRSAVMGYWQRREDKEIKAVLNMLDFEQKLATATEDKKREIQPQIQESVIKAMEEDPSDPMNQVLAAAYRRIRSASTTPGSAGSLGDIAGRWQVSHMNSLTTQNVYSGAIGDSNGMIAEFDIKPDGRVIYSFYLSQVNYGCTTKLKTTKTGRVSVSGSRLVFNYTTGTTTGQDSCNAKYSYAKDLGPTTDTYDFGLSTKDGKRQLCIANDRVKDCAVKLN